MATLGIELCDAGFQAASCSNNESQCLSVADANGTVDWPGFAYFDGQGFAYGRAAENQWFVHPRRVAHTFWARLAHEPSTIGPIGRQAPFSELAFHFFSEFTQRVTAAAPEPMANAIAFQRMKALVIKKSLDEGMTGRIAFEKRR